MCTFSDFLYKFAQQCISVTTSPTSSPSETSQASTSIPKRNRFTWFQSEEGKRRRLSNDGHTLQQSTAQRRCLLCKVKTTCRCETCTVHLCRFPHGPNRRSCWTKFHENKVIELIERSNQNKENIQTLNC